MQLKLDGSPDRGHEIAVERRRQKTVSDRQREAKRQDRINAAKCWTTKETERYAEKIANGRGEIDQEEADFRHANWAEKRARVIETLEATCVSPSTLYAVRNCGACVHVEWSAQENRYRLAGSYCHNRHCEPCMKQKANIIARNLNTRLQDSKDRQYRFITLTVRHNPTDDLLDVLKKLRTAWTNLRARPVWKTTQRGGAAMIEVKWSRHGGWHAHLHVISEGVWVDIRDLKSEWLKVTGDSDIVDIRPLCDKKGAAYYVGKYVRKGANDEIWNDEPAAKEWVTATRGLRTCATYGTWRGFALTKFTTETKDWKSVGTLLTVTHAARHGEEWAIGIMIDLMPSANPDEVRGMYLDGDARLKMLTGDG